MEICLRQRSLRSDVLIASMDTLEIIEPYPDDKYLASFLPKGQSAYQVFHTYHAAQPDSARLEDIHTTIS